MGVAESDWETLISSIELSSVVPVLGPELLVVPDGDRQVPLYRLIAERLAARLDLKPQWRDGAELNDTVCCYLDTNPRAVVEDLYSEINSILRTLELAPPDSLIKLADIAGFDLFVTTTMDSLMVDALNQVRFPGEPSPRTKQVVYAPSLATGEPRDLPKSESTVPIVFNLFGKAIEFEDFAIHDEDYLEFVHRIETDQGVSAELLLKLRTRHLLFIGCEFSDWLNRFLIRLANAERLRTSRRYRRYLASRQSSQDRELTTFLTRFSIRTQVLDLTGTQFVDELFARWRQRHPPVVAAPRADPTAAVTAALTAPTGVKGAIFISYAHEDQAAANTLRSALTSLAGDDVCWFDKSTLKPGDRWEEEILSSIERSARLFLPVISSNTERRTGKGVFFEEWRRALKAQLSNSFVRDRFIMPIVIDSDFQGEFEKYKNIPGEFRALHVGRAPLGMPDESLSNTLKEEIRRMRPENQ
jgi:hypothetical protein